MNDISINLYLKSNSHIRLKAIPELPCEIQDALCLTFQPRDNGILYIPLRTSILEGMFMNIADCRNYNKLHIVSLNA